MSTRVSIVEKLENDQLKTIDERDWDEKMIHMLHHVNYLLVGDKEYEMLEGRLNVDLGVMELLVVASKA
jgi:hypothetical protein